MVSHRSDVRRQVQNEATGGARRDLPLEADRTRGIAAAAERPAEPQAASPLDHESKPLVGAQPNPGGFPLLAAPTHLAECQTARIQGQHHAAFGRVDDFQGSFPFDQCLTFKPGRVAGGNNRRHARRSLHAACGEGGGKQSLELVRVHGQIADALVAAVLQAKTIDRHVHATVLHSAVPALVGRGRILVCGASHARGGARKRQEDQQKHPRPEDHGSESRVGIGISAGTVCVDAGSPAAGGRYWAWVELLSNTELEGSRPTAGDAARPTVR